MNRIVKNLTLLLVVSSVSFVVAQEKRGDNDTKKVTASKDDVRGSKITKGNVTPDGVKSTPKGPQGVNVGQKARVSKDSKPKEAKLKWYQRLGFRGKNKEKSKD